MVFTAESPKIDIEAVRASTTLDRPSPCQRRSQLAIES